MDSNEIKTAILVAAVFLAVVYVNNNYIHLQDRLQLPGTL